MDKNRLEYRQQYQLSLVTTFLVTLAWVAVNMQPKYTNTFYYVPADQVDDASYSTFKNLAYASDILFFISWVVASVNNSSSSNIMDLEPNDTGEDGEHNHIEDGKAVECNSERDEDDY